MKKSIFIFCLIAAAIILTCSCTKNNPLPYTGFWEGPHPVDSSMKFYIEVAEENDSIYCSGYWTKNGFYEASFLVDSFTVTKDTIAFRIPGWGCTYSGIFIDNNIYGGFGCIGEPFDSVPLNRNDNIREFLSLPDKKGQALIHSVEDLNDGLPVSDELSKNEKEFMEKILSGIRSGEYGRINSFLIARDNKLICDEYFFGYKVNDIHPIESCTKSITSLLVGVALDNGLINSTEDPIYNIFPEYGHLEKGLYKDITIKHLLCMKSGYNPQNDELFRSDNRIKFALERGILDKPGSTFRYDGGNTEILGAIIKATSGAFADDYAKKHLFDPLNIKHFDWEIAKQEGYPSMAGSLHLLPRDMVKIGLLVLNKGVFNGQQIVSESWISESTNVHTQTHIPGDNYGYQWWRLELESGEKKYKVIWANGWGGQFIYIFPEINVVIVTTGHNYEYDSWAITKGIKKHLYLLDSNSM